MGDHHTEYYSTESGEEYKLNKLHIVSPIPYRNECCGGYISLREKEMAKNMCDKIKESASGFGAEMLITACPLCMYNLNKSSAELPVYYFTELLAEALGVKEEVK